MQVSKERNAVSNFLIFDYPSTKEVQQKTNLQLDRVQYHYPIRSTEHLFQCYLFLICNSHVNFVQTSQGWTVAGSRIKVFTVQLH